MLASSINVLERFVKYYFNKRACYRKNLGLKSFDKTVIEKIIMTNLHLYPSPITRESRIEKICASLIYHKIFNKIEIIGVLTDELPSSNVLAPSVVVSRIMRAYNKKRSLIGKVVKTLSWSYNVYNKYKDSKINCVSSHSLASLPLSYLLAKKNKAALIYETHELETETVDSHGIRKIFMKLIERFLIHRCDAIIVVSDSIADWYMQKYAIERPTVVRNIPVRPNEYSIEKSTILRDYFGIPKDHFIFIYQGALSPRRQIEQFLRIFAKAPRNRHVVFMGFGELEGLIKDSELTNSNIHFLSSVPPSEVLQYTAGADVGLSGGENVCLSYYYSLPNKLFEYLMAGVPVMANDWPEIRKVIEKDLCGWVVDSNDTSWLSIISSLNHSEIDRIRIGALRTINSYSWNEEENRLISVYKNIIRNNN